MDMEELIFRIGEVIDKKFDEKFDEKFDKKFDEKCYI